MGAIDASRQSGLETLTRDLRRAARTIRSSTLVERDATRAALVTAIRDELEPRGDLDEQGLEALRVWVESLEHASVADVDLLQELLYGIDALVRVHVWRETGMPLAPPEPRPASDV